ncbi:MAG: NUDIX domain-containing protein [Thermoplasmata archaeon]
MELLDVVDNENKIVGTASRSEVHKKRLPHRTVMFFVFSPDDRILVTKRSLTKEFFKGYRSVVLGGHVSAGESYEEALIKEMVEELGTVGGYEHMGDFVKDIPEEVEHVSLFKVTVSPSQVNLDPKEFQEGKFMCSAEIKDRLSEGKFLPETKTVMGFLEDIS